MSAEIHELRPMAEARAEAKARARAEARRAAQEERIQRLEAMASFLDTRYRLPGTSWRFGADGLIGLVPGIGDAVSAGLGLWLIVEAARGGARKRVLTRMGANTALDGLIGSVPLVGDVLDFGFKANRRNARIAADELRRRASAGG